MTHIINGKEIAQNLRESLKTEISELKNKYNAVPGLTIVQIGNVIASSVYIKTKTKNANKVVINGIENQTDGKTKNKLVGDVDYDKVAIIASAITSIPGNV